MAARITLMYAECERSENPIVGEKETVTDDRDFLVSRKGAPEAVSLVDPYSLDCGTENRV